MMILKIHDLEALEKLLKTHKDIVAIFKSTQCIDCDYLDQYIDKIIKPFKNMLFISVYRHELPEVFKHYHVFGVPSFLYFSHGKLKQSLINKRRKHPEDVTAFLQKVKALKEG